MLIIEFMTSNTPLEVEHLPLLILPFIGALIGWMTNYVAVKMLFHPRQPISLLFFTVQGVFPKRQKAFAHKLGSIVSTELFSVDEVTSKLKEKARSPEVRETISKYIQQVITGKLPEVIPMVAMVLTPELVELVREAFLGEIERFIGELIDSMSESIEQDLDVHKIVEEKVANFSSDKLEEILFAIMRREFRFIELIGGLLGFLIGVAQVAILTVLR